MIYKISYKIYVAESHALEIEAANLTEATRILRDKLSPMNGQSVFFDKVNGELVHGAATCRICGSLIMVGSSPTLSEICGDCWTKMAAMKSQVSA
jgi:hypothetical protein